MNQEDQGVPPKEKRQRKTGGDLFGREDKTRSQKKKEGGLTEAGKPHEALGVSEDADFEEIQATLKEFNESYYKKKNPSKKEIKEFNEKNRAYASIAAAEAMRVHENPSEDPFVVKTEREITRITNQDSEVKKVSRGEGTEKYTEIWEKTFKRVSAQQWDNFVYTYPEKATAYKEYPSIKEAFERRERGEPADDATKEGSGQAAGETKAEETEEAILKGIADNQAILDRAYDTGVDAVVKGLGEAPEDKENLRAGFEEASDKLYQAQVEEDANIASKNNIREGVEGALDQLYQAQIIEEANAASRISNEALEKVKQLDKALEELKLRRKKLPELLKEAKQNKDVAEILKLELELNEISTKIKETEEKVADARKVEKLASRESHMANKGIEIKELELRKLQATTEEERRVLNELIYKEGVKRDIETLKTAGEMALKPIKKTASVIGWPIAAIGKTVSGIEMFTGLFSTSWKVLKEQARIISKLGRGEKIPSFGESFMRVWKASKEEKTKK
ncbi:MAG: hypothetical protein Q7S10_03725 [bacterium]|nr:hypothetical protein [bacterium]